MPFEPQFPSQYLHLFHGHIQLKVTDPTGQLPSTIISLQDPWKLEVSWQLHGMLVGNMGGTWHVRAYVESIGPGPEILIAKWDGPITGQNQYNIPFIIQPAALQPPPPDRIEEGAYKLVVVVTSTNLQGGPSPFAGYEEGPVIQFFKGASM